MRELTPKQKKVLAYIAARIAATGRAPTHREIAEHFHWSSNAAAKVHLLALERKGAIRLSPMTARGIEVLP